jgi:hypothetical protein
LSNLGTLGTISQLPELRLNYRLLRWNRGAGSFEYNNVEFEDNLQLFGSKSVA